MSSIKPEIRRIADAVKPFIEHTGNGATKTGDFIAATLPEGLDAKAFQSSIDHLNNLPVALTLATGEVGNELFAKLPDLNEVKADFPVHKQFSVGVLYQRTAEVAAGIGKDAGTKTVHGHAIQKIDATLGKGAAYKNVRSYLSESLAEQLK